jgi:hypothetical protein
MPDRSDHPASFDAARLLVECATERTRRSGPGGQNRNKVETAVVLTHSPTGIRAEANERRSQAENLRAATLRLRVNLALKVRCPVGADQPPSALWQSRCRGERIVVSESHDDFPTLLAEALDMASACAWDVKAAADRLGCTPTQLTKLFRVEARALRLVNEGRRALGLRPLR